jgi:hypothetical protein
MWSGHSLVVLTTHPRELGHLAFVSSWLVLPVRLHGTRLSSTPLAPDIVRSVAFAWVLGWRAGLGLVVISVGVLVLLVGSAVAVLTVSMGGLVLLAVAVGELGSIASDFGTSLLVVCVLLGSKGG